jgi:ribosome recycling factor
MQEILNSFREELEKSFGWFRKELQKIKGSKVAPELIEDIKVQCYGGEYKLKEVSSISVVDSRTLCVEPWDKNILKEIEKSLWQANLGAKITPQKDKIFFAMPLTTEEDKKNLIKLLSQIMEKAKKAMRHQRNEVLSKIEDMENKGEISEDEKFKLKKEIQEIFDEFKDKIEKEKERKEKEILS